MSQPHRENTTTNKYTLSQHDVDILRRLTERQVEIARSPLNLERKALWYKHDTGTDGRPMILAEAFDVRDEVLPLPNSTLECQEPWADEEFMAQELGSDVIYCRKPNPALISTERFDEDAIRADIRHTLTAAKDCRVEIVMKDVHTLNNEPWCLPHWVEIARQAVDEIV